MVKRSNRSTRDLRPAKVTSKGQITVPREVRQLLGISAGDKVRFERDEQGVRMLPLRSRSAFGKYRGIGNPGVETGREGIVRWLRELRGDDDQAR
jgi:antitoxin PrlF